ncbi:MAG: type II toxin-antitoxin system PemK/MazF family toxin [Cyanobacteria bacterium P01_H01_bin.153]
MVVKGSVVLVNFPFTDLSQSKLRPAIVLWLDPTGSDVVVCAITSQKVSSIDETEMLISDSDPEFSQTGLRVTSKVRVTRIATLNRQLVIRKLGDLGKQQHQQLNILMLQAFQLV